MPATVFFQSVGGNDVAVLTMTFLNNLGAVADPTTVFCIVTDPTGAATTHTYLGAIPADITRVSMGVYTLLIPATIVGLWGWDWQGTGTPSDVDAGTFTVNPAASINQFYTSVEELQDRLGITSTVPQLQLQIAVQSAAKAIEQACGRHFYQLAETRTFVPYSIWEQPIDDLVSLTSLSIDTTGNGTFDQVWTLGTDFELGVDPLEFNINASGEPRPYTWVGVINAMSGGKFFPYIWPFSKRDRVQIVGTWGWPQVPFAIKQASMQVASEFFKLKDAPFGLAGTSEFGLVRVPKQNPYIQALLPTYKHPRRKVGV